MLERPLGDMGDNSHFLKCKACYKRRHQMARIVLNKAKIKVGRQIFDLLKKPAAVKRLFLGFPNSIIMAWWVGNPLQTLEISVR